MFLFVRSLRSEEDLFFVTVATGRSRVVRDLDVRDVRREQRHRRVEVRHFRNVKNTRIKFLNFQLNFASDAFCVRLFEQE